VVAFIKAFLMSLNDRSHWIVHGKLSLLETRSSKGAANVGNLGMKRRKYPASPRNDLM
jgi:hypothetical protein